MVSILNRNAFVRADGTWDLSNIPANLGPVRARVNCVIDGEPVSGESDPFTIPANGFVPAPAIHFGPRTPIPRSLRVSASSTTVTTVGGTTQLTVSATYQDGTTADVTGGSTGTRYQVSNANIATVSADGVVTAVASGTVLVQARLEGASGFLSVKVALTGADSDGDGIPDDVELALGMNPNSATDALEDFDRDGLTNLQEYRLGSDLRRTDTDGDGLTDGEELNIYQTNAFVPDTDGDLIPDGIEVRTKTDPLDWYSYDLRAATATSVVTPPAFSLEMNPLFPSESVQLRWKVTLIDGKTTLDLTNDERTSYGSDNLAACSFGGQKGLVFEGAAGKCVVTVRQNTLSVMVPGSVEAFTPKQVSTLSIPGAQAIDVSGDFAYVAAGAQGLVIVDIFDRAKPRIRSTMTGIGVATDVRAVSGRVFVADVSGFLREVSVTDPDAPVLISSLGMLTPRVLAVDGDIVAVGGGAGLLMVNVNTPTAPRVLSATKMPATIFGIDINRALGVAAVAMGQAGLQVVDVSSLSAPALGGRLTGGDVRRVRLIAPATALLADYSRGVTAVDLSVPAQPAVASSVPYLLGGLPVDIAVSGQVAITADNAFGAAVPVIDVADPLRPSTILYWNLDHVGWGTAVAMDGTFGYLITLSTDLQIFQYQRSRNGYAAGRVTDAVSHQGLSGATVRLFDRAAKEVAAAPTDGSGDYVIRVPVGSYYATTASSPGHVGGLYAGLVCQNCDPRSGTTIEISQATTSTGIDFALDVGGGLAGRITDLTTGLPVPGIQVSVADGNGSFAASTVTGATGDFTVADLSPGTYYARTSDIAGRYGDALFSGKVCANCVITDGTPIDVTVGSTTPGVDFSLRPRERISGRVTDATTGAPLANLRVEVYSEFGGLITSASTNPSGDYLTPIVAAGHYRVRTGNASSNGYVDGLFGGGDCLGCSVISGADVQVVAGFATRNVDLGLHRLGRISGRVIDGSTGVGISGVYINVCRTVGWPYSCIGGVLSGSTGDYLFPNLPPGTYYASTWGAKAPYLDRLFAGLDCRQCDVTKGTPIVVVADATTPNIDFALATGGRMTGRVTDRATGTGLASVVLVFTSSAQPNLVLYGFTDATGGYSIDQVPAGDYYAHTEYAPRGFLNESYLGGLCVLCGNATGTPIAVTLGTTISNIDFHLAKGGTVSGRVTDALTGTGIGSAWWGQGVSVILYDSVGGYVASAATDANGGYAIGAVAPGTYFAATWVTRPGYMDSVYAGLECAAGSCPVKSGTPIVVGLSATVPGVDFALKPRGSMSGRITDSASGAGLSNVFVGVYTAAGVYTGIGAASSATGDYTIQNLAPGNYYARTFWASAGGRLDGLYTGRDCVSCNVTAGTLISVVGGTMTTGVDFALKPSGRISGRVTDGASGVGLPNVAVWVHDAAGGFVTSAYTNTSGTYTASGLVSGTYYVRTSNAPAGRFDVLYTGQPCQACDVTTGTPISVSYGSTVSGVDLPLLAGGRIRGRATDAVTGASLGGVSVLVVRQDGALAATTQSSATGDYLMSGLAGGTYFARTSGMAGYVDGLYAAQDCRQCAATNGTPISVAFDATTTSIDFALKPLGGLVTGRVTDAATGAGLANVSVVVYSNLGAIVATAISDASGNWGLVTRVPAGTYFAKTSNYLGRLEQLYSGVTCGLCTVTAGTPIVVTDGTTTSGVDFALPAPGSVRFDVIKSFTGRAPTHPSAALIQGSDGGFYGTTVEGGAFSGGALFKIATDGTMTTLHDLNATTEGRIPIGSLLEASDGYFYGTAALNNGSPNNGRVFRLGRDGSFSVLHAFGSDGNPTSGLIETANGDKLGTTTSSIFKIAVDGTFSTLRTLTQAEGAGAGLSTLTPGTDGFFYGTTPTTIFKVASDGSFVLLHTLTASEGRGFGPSAGYGPASSALVLGSDGNFYGTTYSGGAANLGTVYRMTPAGQVTVLHSFAGGADGAAAAAGLIQATDGNFYGTTMLGGTANLGTVYQMTPAGDVTTVHSFTGPDGAKPLAGLLQAADGKLYGTTFNGSTSAGVAFSLDLSGSAFSVFGAFVGNAEGAGARAPLFEAADGSLYGVTGAGGLADAGTAFRVTPDDHFELLSPAVFTGDGRTPANPATAVIQGGDGNLYGLDSNVFDPAAASGVSQIFKLASDGTATVVYRFSAESSQAPLLKATDGNLYGTTTRSIFRLSPSGVVTTLGTSSLGSALIQASDGNFYGTTDGQGISAGTAFRLTPSGVKTVLHVFNGGSDGARPGAALVQASDGFFYGTTISGGAFNRGTIFRMTSTGVVTILHSFTGGTDGTSPRGALVQAPDGNLYGTAFGTGAPNRGTVFRMSTSGSLTVLYEFTGGADGGNPTGLVLRKDGVLFGAAGNIFRISIPPPPAPGAISGVVTDARTGQPVGFGTGINVQDAQGHSKSTFTFDANGRYTVTGLAPGTYWATTDVFDFVNYVNQAYGGQLCDRCNALSGTPIGVTAGATTSGIDFALTPGGVITGNVRDVTSNAGITAVQVESYDTGGVRGRMSFTSASGDFTINGLTDGVHYLRTRQNGNLYADEVFEDVPCSNTTCPITSGTPITTTRGTITGGVTFNLGVPGVAQDQSFTPSLFNQGIPLQGGFTGRTCCEAQTFTAGVTGTLSSVELRLLGAGSVQLSINDFTSGVLGSVLQALPYVAVNAPSNTYVSFSGLNVPVVAGRRYAIVAAWQNSTLVWSSVAGSGATYNGGDAYFSDGAGVWTNRSLSDNAFATFVTVP